MVKLSISCGTEPATTIFQQEIGNTDSFNIVSTADPGGIKFKTGSTDKNTSVTFENRDGVISAAFHSDGQSVFNGQLFAKTEHITVIGDALTNNTYTAAQLLKGIITREGTASFNDKMPGATDVVNAIGNALVNSAFWCTFRNKLTNVGNTITLVNSDDGTFTLVDTNKTINKDESVTWLMVVTSITAPKTISGYLVGSSTLV